MTNAEPSADDVAILWTAAGRKHEIVLASYFKRLIIAEGMTAGERLAFLEGLNRMLSPAALARIVPADDVSMEIIETALGLDRGSEGCEHSFGVLTSEEVFRTLLALNPSLLTALQHGAGVVERPRPGEADAPAGERAAGTAEFV